MDHCKEQGPSNLGAQVSKLGGNGEANWARWSRGPRVAAPQPAHSLTNGAGGAAGGPSPSSHPLWQPCQEV